MSGQIALFAAQQGITYLTAKYILMPYLRGSTKAKYSKPSATTIQNQINVLKRKVAQNASQKNFIRQNLTAVAAGGTSGSNYNLTSDFIATATYRDYVNGDKFANHWVKLSLLSEIDVTALRIIVYTPKKTGTSFSVPTTAAELALIPDPAAFTIFMDRWINPYESTLSRSGHHMLVNLRRMVTDYNGSSSTLEKGEVKVWIGWSKTSGSSTVMNCQTMLCVSDK